MSQKLHCKIVHVHFNSYRATLTGHKIHVRKQRKTLLPSTPGESPLTAGDLQPPAIYLFKIDTALISNPQNLPFRNILLLFAQEFSEEGRQENLSQ